MGLCTIISPCPPSILASRCPRVPPSYLIYYLTVLPCTGHLRFTFHCSVRPNRGGLPLALSVMSGSFPGTYNFPIQQYIESRFITFEIQICHIGDTDGYQRPRKMPLLPGSLVPTSFPGCHLLPGNHYVHPLFPPVPPILDIWDSLEASLYTAAPVLPMSAR